MKDPKAREEALLFMQQKKICVVATIGENGEPQAATVMCLVDDSFNVYFGTMANSRKFKNLEKNKNVGIALGTNPNIPTCAQLQGKAEILKDPKDVMVEYFDKRINLMEGFPTAEWAPLIKMKDRIDLVVVKVKPHWLRFMNLDIKNGGKEMFHQIIP